jgi:molybdenum cofactor cytidylyltransferase
MIAAVVLAAGLSRRMGRPKLVLPWGTTTVIGRVASVLLEAGVSPVVVVIGGAHSLVDQALQGLPVRTAFNPRHAEDQMILSLQIGLAELPETVEAALVALGDQPQIEPSVVGAVMAEYRSSRAAIVVPSYQKRRGHPWLLDRQLWPALLGLAPPATLREFLQAQTSLIRYLPVETASILKDLDTPDDYASQAP